MRRLKILLYWLMGTKNNVGFLALIKFLIKPTSKQIALQNIEKIEKKEFYEVTFTNIPDKLFWPISFNPKAIYQICSETFDPNDWHYYQKGKTTIEENDILLDIGTAEGLFPLLVVKKCEKMFLIEPSHLFAECLRKTFASYKDKVTIFNVAVGNEDGVINFTQDSLEGKITEKDSSQNNTIDIRKIDSLIPKSQKITYLKADIEGFELEMLKGAKDTITNNKPKIAITTYHKENNPSEIIKLILSYVPEYKYYLIGIHEQEPKPVMIHFWIE